MTRSRALLDLAVRSDEPRPARTSARRVAQVIPSLEVGGLQKIVVRLVHHLRPHTENLVLTPSSDGPLRGAFPDQVRVVAMAGQRLSGKWNALGMARVFRAFRPDIVHTRNWTCIDAIIAARLAGVPIVVHGEHGREAADPDGSNAFRRRLRRCLNPLITEFVAVSRDLNGWLVHDVGVPARKVTQICNGVDTETFTPLRRESVRSALGIAQDQLVIGTVGRLDPVKDHRSLIQAFSRLRPDRRHLLFIVGDGPTRAALDRLRLEVGLGDQIHLLGERNDVSLLLPALDIFVLPSLAEGISNAILEAMASGLPVVATRVGGNPELVQDGVTGTLVPPRSSEALAAALAGYLADPTLIRTHGDAGRLRAVREFSLAGMFAAYDSLYSRLLSARRIA
jgi:sugar transferase (PEP-CTERM/EpsH1 system associated)